MTKQGALPFDFTDGSCNTFQTLIPIDYIEHIYLCFGSGDLITDRDQVPMEYGCYYTDVMNLNESYSYNAKWEFVQSSYSHRNTLGLGNYRGRPFVTGCDRRYDGCDTETEIIEPGNSGLYEILTGDYLIEWWSAPEYPFASNSRLVHFLLTYSAA